MWHEGKIVEWKDDRGFGFVESPLVDGRIFFHIKNFTRRDRRPVVGDSVVVSVGQDDRGRTRAVTISYVDDPRQDEDGNNSAAVVVAAVVTGVFIALLLADILFGQLPAWILGFYAVMSPVSIHLYRLDKNAARNGEWRVSERTLFLVDLLGGWIGAVFAQVALRHKVRKVSFLIPFWAIVSAHFLLCLLAGEGTFGALFTGTGLAP